MFKKMYLENGIPVLMEYIEGIRSVTIGIWVKTGTRYENPEKNGISHFLEHMFFKGTKNRSQKDIAIEIDSLGGDLNAFTSRENTTFYVKVLDDFIGKGIDILSDIFSNSLFKEEDIKREKQIIKEEIKMIEDTPDDNIHDLFFQDIWGKKSLGMPVTGTNKTVNSLTRQDIISFIKKYYGTNDMVISCAGNIEKKRIFSIFQDTLGYEKRNSIINEAVKPDFSSGATIYKKDLSDVHICIGVEGIKQNSKLRYPFLLINTIFGSGVSSRLFQEIREKRGLVYSIYSFLSSYYDTGVFGVYAATGKRKYAELIETVLREMKTLKDSITDDELENAKSQLKGNIILALESSSGRMNNIARQEIYYGKYFSPAEIIRGIERVKLKQVKKTIEEYINTNKIAVTLLGPADKNIVKNIV